MSRRVAVRAAPAAVLAVFLLLCGISYLGNAVYDMSRAWWLHAGISLLAWLDLSALGWAAARCVLGVVRRSNRRR